MNRNKNSMQMYLVRFTGPDGDHIAVSHSIQMTDDRSRAEVIDGITRTIKPATRQYPQGHPDIRITEIKPATYEEVVAAAQKLKDENPNRPLANELDLDTPTRILAQPEIMDEVAAKRIPG